MILHVRYIINNITFKHCVDKFASGRKYDNIVLFINCMGNPAVPGCTNQNHERYAMLPNVNGEHVVKYALRHIVKLR